MHAGPHRAGTASVPEAARFCPACDGPVGRGRDGRPGRERGVCPWCRAAYDLTPALAPGDLVVGDRDSYRVRAPWRPGSRGWIYLADPIGAAPDAPPVVLTRLEGPEGPAAGTLAVTEPRVLLDLDVPGLVTAHDVATASETAGPSRHLVLDHVPGRRPDEDGRPSPAAALDIVLGLAVPLAALHERGLLHADVTPANVLVADGPEGSGDRLVTLMDLGSLRRATDRDSDVWGTTGFLAPELSPGGAGPSIASDVYALGRTLAVLLLDFDHTRGHALRLPEVGSTPLLAAHPGLAALLATATATDPDARHADVAAFVAQACVVREGSWRAAAGAAVHHVEEPHDHRPVPTTQRPTHPTTHPTTQPPTHPTTQPTGEPPHPAA